MNQEVPAASDIAYFVHSASPKPHWTFAYIPPAPAECKSWKWGHWLLLKKYKKKDPSHAAIYKVLGHTWSNVTCDLKLLHCQLKALHMCNHKTCFIDIVKLST